MKFIKAKIVKPLSFVVCGHFISDEDWVHERRIINNIEIIIGLKGTTYIQQDEEKYEVKPGNVLVLLPGQVHFGYASSDLGTSFYWVHFLCNDSFSILEDKDVLDEISYLNSKQYLSTLNESIIIPIFSELHNTEKVLIQFRQLLHTTHSQYYSSYAANYLVTLLTIELTQQVINETLVRIDNTSINDKKFVGILEWLKINIHKEISVQQLADKFGFNPDYLTRLFKKHLGVSTLSYINEMKIAKGKEFLTQTEASIKEISYSLGFKDEKYFMKLFKQYEGITPSKYRNAYHKTYLNNK